MIKAVIFDLDNTLVDFMKMKHRAIEAAVTAMIDAGLNMTLDGVVKRVILTGAMIAALTTANIAQTIRGRVYDLMKWPDKVPIENATVKFQTSKGVDSTTTDMWGEYSIDITDLITSIEQTDNTNAQVPVRFSKGTGSNLQVYGMNADNITLGDVLGRRTVAEGNGNSLDLSNMSSGFYFFKAENENEEYMGFFMLVDGHMSPKSHFIYQNKTTGVTHGLRKTNNSSINADDIIEATVISEEIYTRETKIMLDADGDTEQDFDVVSVEEFPDSLMEFYNAVSYRNSGIKGFQTIRWVTPPQIYITADTTDTRQKEVVDMLVEKFTDETKVNFAYKTPLYPDGFYKDIANSIEIGMNPPERGTEGYFFIKFEDVGGPIAATTKKFDSNTGIIYFAETRYDISTQDYQINQSITKELATEFGRSMIQESMFNLATNYMTKDWQIENDRKMNLFLYARPPGSKFPDKDNGWDYQNMIPLGQGNQLKVQK